eukprot:TRINITY_DN2818_c0_g1_i4.p1 TRINITY_DN2818_c0_g1~~TRINITY_DN2818_c0_g1_i4.p1  ORF type:complete len:100 (-),score=27.81 TRINITY_DN2818_c0_g1_i4:175-474(-)
MCIRDRVSTQSTWGYIISKIQMEGSLIDFDWRIDLPMGNKKRAADKEARMMLKLVTESEKDKKTRSDMLEISRDQLDLIIKDLDAIHAQIAAISGKQVS